MAARSDVVTLAEDPDDHAAYVAVNKVILAEASRFAGTTAPVVLLIWDGASRGDGDLTADLGTEASARGWPIKEVSTV